MPRIQRRPGSAGACVARRRARPGSLRSRPKSWAISLSESRWSGLTTRFYPGCASPTLFSPESRPPGPATASNPLPTGLMLLILDNAASRAGGPVQSAEVMRASGRSGDPWRSAVKPGRRAWPCGRPCSGCGCGRRTGRPRRARRRGPGRRPRRRVAPSRSSAATWAPRRWACAVIQPAWSSAAAEFRGVLAKLIEPGPVFLGDQLAEPIARRRRLRGRRARRRLGLDQALGGDDPPGLRDRPASQRALGAGKLAERRLGPLLDVEEPVPRDQAVPGDQGDVAPDPEAADPGDPGGEVEHLERVGLAARPGRKPGRRGSTPSTRPRRRRRTAPIASRSARRAVRPGSTGRAGWPASWRRSRRSEARSGLCRAAFRARTRGVVARPRPPVALPGRVIATTPAR